MPKGIVNPNYQSYEVDEDSEQLDLSEVTSALERVERAVLSKKSVDAVEVKNLDEIKKHLRLELKAVVDAVKSIDIPEAPKTVAISNFPKMDKHPDSVKVNNLSELSTHLERLLTAVEGLNMAPVVNVEAPIVHIPEQMAPIVNIPQSLPPVVNMDVYSLLEALHPLKLLSRDPNKPITVRMSDGRSFIDAIANTLKENGDRMATVVSTSYGLTKDEFKSAQRELNDASNAVNGKVTIGAVSTSVLSARSRISIILTNDSDEAIYVAKGATAVLNEGIRLNSYGGSITIDDWGGAVSAISTSGAKNLCYCETY